MHFKNLYINHGWCIGQVEVLYLEKLKSLWNFFRDYFVIGKILSLLWCNWVNLHYSKQRNIRMIMVKKRSHWCVLRCRLAPFILYDIFFAYLKRINLLHFSDKNGFTILIQITWIDWYTCRYLHMCGHLQHINSF